MQFQETDGRIWAEDQAGKLVAEITFPEARPGVADIDHTFVDASLRGQGAAGRLVEAAVAQLRRRDIEGGPHLLLCPAVVPGPPGAGRPAGGQSIAVRRTRAWRRADNAPPGPFCFFPLTGGP